MIKKKLIVSAVALMIAPVISLTVGSTYAYASAPVQAQQPEQMELVEEEMYEFVKNDLYIQFENELSELQESTGGVSKEEAFQLIEKYDGAKVTVISSEDQPGVIQPNSVQITSTSHQFVSGGVNSFATTTASMQSLSNTYRNAADAAFVGGTIVGFPLGIFGALIAGLSSGALANKFDTAADIMSQWYSSSALQGGVRLTLTDTFAINYANSITPATII